MGLVEKAWEQRKTTGPSSSGIGPVLDRLGATVRRLVAVDPFTRTIGIGRTLVALATLITLLSTDTATLFHPAAGLSETPNCGGIASAGIYCIVGPAHLETARWLSIALLLPVVMGWRPRFTAILHWWVAFSLMANAVVIDGGDHVAGVLSLVLIPLLILDPRRSHWVSRHEQPATAHEELRRWMAIVALAIVKFQVALVYFQSAIAKLGVAEWADGTALYYFLTDPTFGAQGWMRGGVELILRHGLVVSGMTWLAIALELTIAISVVTGRPSRKWVLASGIVFHALIAIIMGLVSFAVVMAGALVLALHAGTSADTKSCDEQGRLCDATKTP